MLKRAFTLVELLVVIGIIAVLISVLLPALNRARQQAQQTACMSNLRQLGAASSMHAAEHRNHFPLAGRLWGATADPGGAADANERNYSYFTDSGAEHVAPLPIALAPYLGQQFRSASPIDEYNRGSARKVFICPSNVDNLQDSYFIGDYAWSGPSLITSYGFNEAVLGWADAPDGYIAGHNRARGNLSRITMPADMMYLADAAPRLGLNAIVFDELNGDETLADVYSREPALFDVYRHRGRMNILFMDGHVEPISIPGQLGVVNVSRGLH